MVAHEDIGVENDGVRLEAVGELLEKALATGIVVKNALARVASGGEVIKRAGEFKTRRTGHNGIIVLDAGRTCQRKVYCAS